MGVKTAKKLGGDSADDYLSSAKQSDIYYTNSPDRYISQSGPFGARALPLPIMYVPTL